MPLETKHLGSYYNQYLANVQYSMVVPQSELNHFREFTSLDPDRSEPNGDYVSHYVEPNRAQGYLSAKAVMSEPLPMVTNG